MMEDNRPWTLVRLGSKPDRRVMGIHSDRDEADRVLALLIQRQHQGVFSVLRVRLLTRAFKSRLAGFGGTVDVAYYRYMFCVMRHSEQKQLSKV